MSTDTNEQQHDPESLKACIERCKDNAPRIGELVGASTMGTAGLFAGAGFGGGILSLPAAAAGVGLGFTGGTLLGNHFGDTFLGRHTIGITAGITLKARIEQRRTSRKLAPKLSAKLNAAISKIKPTPQPKQPHDVASQQTLKEA